MIMRVSTKVMVGLISLLLVSQSQAFSDEAKQMASSSFGERVSTVLAETMSERQYGVCAHTNITALAFWARGALPDTSNQAVQQIVSNGLKMYRNTFAARNGTTAPLDGIIESLKPLYDADQQSFWQECNGMVNAIMQEEGN
jgi:hypothetical protein